MKALIDISHPAHAHFFRNPVRLLRQAGHEVVITSREKECATLLLDEFGLQHTPLSSHEGGGLWRLGKELLQRNLALLNVVRQERPNVMAAIGGTCVAHVGKLARIPSQVYYDTENAALQNAITYPLVKQLFVPQCYQGKTPPQTTRRYAGYHELAYLHPHYFQADYSRAVAAGLAKEQATFVLRLVSWQANHDLNEHGWSPQLLRRVSNYLQCHGKVIVTSEQPLAPEFEYLRYRGAVSDLHHLLAFSRGMIGESATMASECAVLGVPSIYCATTGRGYTDEQQQRYGLVENVRELNWQTLKPAIDRLLANQEAEHQRRQLLADCVDVSRMVTDNLIAAAL